MTNNRLTLKEAAERLAVSPARLRKIANAGDAYGAEQDLVSGRWTFDASQLHRFTMRRAKDEARRQMRLKLQTPNPENTQP